MTIIFTHIFLKMLQIPLELIDSIFFNDDQQKKKNNQVFVEESNQFYSIFSQPRIGNVYQNTIYIFCHQ